MGPGELKPEFSPRCAKVHGIEQLIAPSVKHQQNAVGDMSVYTKYWPACLQGRLFGATTDSGNSGDDFG
jgi:hypothetical protein